jgi:hypothetical protein
MLRALRDWLDKHSRADIPQELKFQGIYYFGSAAKAFGALKTERRILLGWSTRKIIALSSVGTAQKRTSVVCSRLAEPSGGGKRSRSVFRNLGQRSLCCGDCPEFVSSP